MRPADRVAVVCTGPSIADVDLGALCATGVTIVAVNAAVSFLPRADYFVTIDPGLHVLRFIFDRRDGVEYWVGMPAGWLPHGGPLPGYVNYLVSERFPMEMSDDPSKITCVNSGLAGVNFAAIKLGASRVAVFGMDAHGRYGHPTEVIPTRKMDLLPSAAAKAAQFLKAAHVEVVNASPGSRVEAFRRMPSDQSLDWLIGE